MKSFGVPVGPGQPVDGDRLTALVKVYAGAENSVLSFWKDSRELDRVSSIRAGSSFFESVSLAFFYGRVLCAYAPLPTNLLVRIDAGLLTQHLLNHVPHSSPLLRHLASAVAAVQGSGAVSASGAPAQPLVSQGSVAKAQRWAAHLPAEWPTSQVLKLCAATDASGAPYVAPMVRLADCGQWYYNDGTLSSSGSLIEHASNGWQNAYIHQSREGGGR
jgi:hypothetical protein